MAKFFLTKPEEVVLFSYMYQNTKNLLKLPL